MLLAQHMRPEAPVRPARVARRAGGLGQVQDDRHRQHVMLPGQLDERLARARLDAGRVDNGQPPGRQPLARDEVQHVEGVGGGGLVAAVVADQPAAEV